jgi:hypothetical protein
LRFDATVRRPRRTELDRRLRAEARADARARRTRGQRLTRRAGLPLAVAGAALFTATFVGNAAGFRVLPFDQHHAFGQLGGGALAVLGIAWATR